MKIRYFLALFYLTACSGTDSRPYLELFRRRNSGVFFEGETVKVSCRVSGAKKAPRLIWLLSFRPIRPEGNENVNINTTINGTSAVSILTIRNVTFEQLNRHFILCKDVGNGKSSLNTDFLKIGKLIVSSSGELFSKYGKDKVLTCSLTKGKTEEIDYLMWRKISTNNVLKRTSHTTSLQLHLKKVNETDGGVYECAFHAKNGDSFFLNKSIEIKVRATNIGQKQRIVTYRIFESVKLTCDVRGYPLTILWTKNCSSRNPDAAGEKFNFSHTLENDNRTLVINETSSMSQGEYCCVGWNEGGTAKQIFILNKHKSCGDNGVNNLTSGLCLVFLFLVYNQLVN